jgi:hypothetical protein
MMADQIEQLAFVQAQAQAQTAYHAPPNPFISAPVGGGGGGGGGGGDHQSTLEKMVDEIERQALERTQADGVAGRLD